MANEPQPTIMLDEDGLDVFLRSFFAKVEERHIRSSSYQSKIQSITTKITKMEEDTYDA